MPSGRVVEPTATAARRTSATARTRRSTRSSQALADANPGFVTIKTAPRKCVEGRDVKYLEITNNVDAAETAKPVFFNMGLIHGNEWAACEHTIEFIYDVINTSKTNPKVKALFDKVKFIVDAGRQPGRLVRYRRANCVDAAARELDVATRAST